LPSAAPSAAQPAAAAALGAAAAPADGLSRGATLGVSLPEALRALRRVRDGVVGEVILALNATVEGQTTAHYVADRLAGLGCRVTRLAHGVPVGGELDYLDDGTLIAALKSRRSL
jgi:recombination protein RecR